MNKNPIKISRIYRNELIRTKLHIFFRSIVCPYSKLIPYFPPKGDILDIGCGHGLFLYYLQHDTFNNGRNLFGIDHDVDKIGVARRYADKNMEFSQRSLDSLPGERFDVISVMDVMYCISMDKWRHFLDGCYRALKPDGKLIIKEAIDKPRWKSWLTILEEKLAIDLFGITKGERAHFESMEAYKSSIENSGFNVREIKLINSILYNHCLFIAEKPKNGSFGE